MDLTPQSLRSSASPCPYKPQGPSNIEYYQALQNDNQSAPRETSQGQGLGLFDCRMSGSLNELEGAVSLPTSTIATSCSIPALQSGVTSQSTPNILSAEYDPFAPFQSEMASSYDSNHLYTARSTGTSLPATSPTPSCINSHRSSFSSAPASETYSHPDPYSTAFNPRIKLEDSLEWPSDNNGSLLITGPQTDCSILSTSTSTSPFNGCLDASFFQLQQQQQEQMTWSKMDGLGNNYSNPTVSVFGGATQQLPQPRRLFSNIARTRTPRKMTTREDANFQCKAKGCGKLFSRSYNFKAHMETHDAGRVYPFPCPLPDCTKKFVRKTDLQRHHQSVHMKERNFQCDFCGRFFARKDTLRR
jgi:hypothetical protein